MRIGLRFIIGLLFFCIAAACCTIHSNAETENPLDSLTETAAEMEIPSEIKNRMLEIGVNPNDPNTVTAISPDSMFRKIADYFIEEASTPVRLCGMLLTVTVLCALLNSMSDCAADTNLKRVFRFLTCAVCAGTACEPLCTCMTRTAQTLESGKVFMGSYIPVFTGFLAAGGSIAGSAAYQTFVLFLTEGIMQLTGSILFPLIQTAAALGIADAMNPRIKLSSISSGIHAAVKWILGFVMTMFSALLSVRSFVAASADSLAAKSVRLITSGAVPIIGSAVADAYGTVQGSISVLRNGVGAIGILVIIWLILPPVISVMLYRAAFRITLMFAEPAGAECMVLLCKNALQVLSVIFALLVSFSVMLIISSAVMMLLTGNNT